MVDYSIVCYALLAVCLRWPEIPTAIWGIFLFMLDGLSAVQG